MRTVTVEMNMTFTTFTDTEEKEFYRLQRFYWREALRCEEAKAYLAGCVMLGSSLEALLMLMVNCHPDEAGGTGKVPIKNGEPRPLLDWGLAHLLDVAKAANWLPATLDVKKDDRNNRKAHIGDHAEILRMLRNLAHPARYATDHYHRRVTAKYLKRQFEIVLLCRDWLVQHNNKVLLAHMKEEGIS